MLQRRGPRLWMLHLEGPGPSVGRGAAEASVNWGLWCHSGGKLEVDLTRSIYAFLRRRWGWGEGQVSDVPGGVASQMIA